MIADIVIDTNVFVHANNPDNVDRQRESLTFLEAMCASATFLCVDEGFDYLEEAKNRSRIASEYLRHVRAGMYGHYLLQFLARSGRIAFVAGRVPKPISRKIQQKVPNRGDCMFVKVAHNSQGRALVSHDERDFSKRIRKVLKDELGVTCVEAHAATPLVNKPTPKRS
jgi:predicted nucleic acid-binding protein